LGGNTGGAAGGGGITIGGGSGAVTVSSTASNKIVDTAALTVKTSGTYSIGTTNETVGALSLQGGTISSTSGVLTASSYGLQSGSISAIIGGSGTITKTTAGTATLSGVNTTTGTADILGGTLALASTGSISGKTIVNISETATLDTTAQSYNMLGTQTYTLSLDPTGAGSAALIKASALNITNAIVNFATLGSLDDTAYIIASYTALTGGSFASAGPVSGYTIDYNYLGGNQIALVAVPEPSTYVLLTLGACVLIYRSRRNKLV
jgi:fibronectin-binding autotransporter adhesin